MILRVLAFFGVYMLSMLWLWLSLYLYFCVAWYTYKYIIGIPVAYIDIGLMSGPDFDVHGVCGGYGIGTRSVNSLC